MSNKQCKLCPVYLSAWQDNLVVSKRRKSKLRKLKSENDELLQLCEEARQLIKKQGRLIRKLVRDTKDLAAEISAVQLQTSTTSASEE